MSDAKRMLERTGDRFEMPEPAMDRLLHRRERRQRNERIGAAVVGLGVAAAGIVGVVVTLRVTAPTAPAAGTEPTAAAEGGGLVLPTIAVWIAIVVLGLTAFAAIRVRARFAELDEDVKHRPTERDGAVAPARRRTAESGSPRRTGGTDMNIKPKADVVGLAGSEVPAIAFDDGKLRRTNRWLIGAVVVLALAVVALGTALIASAGEETATKPLGLAPAGVVEALDANAAALNAMDTEALAGSYADYAVVTDAVAGREFEGAEKIAKWYTKGWPTDWNLERVSEVIQLRAEDPFTFAAFAFTSSRGSGIAVFKLHDLEIIHHWIIG